MKFDLSKVIPIVAGAVPLGSLGAFFLYVSPVTILYVAALLTAMALVFALRVLPAIARLSEDEGGAATLPPQQVFPARERQMTNCGQKERSQSPHI